MRIHFQADISIVAIGLVIQRPELVRGALHVVQAEGFIDDDRFFSLKGHGPNLLVILMAFYNRLLKNGGIRGHPPQAILFNQASKLSTGDQIAPDVVQPDGLTERP